MKVILISVDTLRADHLGCYGYELPTSPNIDKMASGGVIFKNHYSTDVPTPPAYTAMFCGRRGLHNGIFGFGHTNYGYKPGPPMLAQHLANAEYRTGMISNLLYPCPWLVAGFHEIIPPGLRFQRGSAEEVTQEASDWLKRNAQRDFFLFVHYWDPHGPYFIAPQKYKDMFFNRDYSGIAHSFSMVKSNPMVEEVYKVYNDGASEGEYDPAKIMAAYDSEIRYADDCIGELFDCLEELNIADEVLLMLTSDHGEAFGEKGFIDHISCYESVSHVPFIVKWPQKIPAGQVVEGYSLCTDIMPTILELCGLAIPKGICGRSLVSAVLNGEDTPHKEVVTNSAGVPIQRMYIKDGMALVHTMDKSIFEYINTYELFDLSNDKAQEKDLNGKPYFWLGDTQWQLFRSFTHAEAETILENRRSKGFTVIQVMLTGVGDGTKPNLQKATHAFGLAVGQTPWINNEPTTPNEAYFKNVDSIIQLGRQKGLVFVLGVFHQLQTSRITPKNARTYATWLAGRYREVPNIIWSMYPKARGEFVPVIRELAAGVQDGDEGRHIITVHPDPAPASSSFMLHDESWMDFNSIQTWKAVNQIYPMMTEDYNLKPAFGRLLREPMKPVVMAEGAYEEGIEYGFEVTPLWIRRQAYYTYLAGGHHSYGHNDSWRVWPTWKEALDAPGAFQMGVLKKIFLDRKEWWNLVPEQSIFVNGGQINGDVFNLAARHKNGKWLMVYLASRISFSINMNKITAGNEVNAFWLEPKTGDSISIGNFSNTGTESFSTPDEWEDAILILETSGS